MNEIKRLSIGVSATQRSATLTALFSQARWETEIRIKVPSASSRDVSCLLSMWGSRETGYKNRFHHPACPREMGLRSAPCSAGFPNGINVQDKRREFAPIGAVGFGIQ
jgi:hypothetical protein